MPKSPELERKRRQDREVDDHKYDMDRRERKKDREGRDKDTDGNKDRDRYKSKRDRGDEDTDGDRNRHGDREKGNSRYDSDRRERKRERSRSRDRSYKKEKKRRDYSESRSPSPSRKTKKREAKAAAKAAAKREAELENSRAMAELSMYSAADNPFHDVNLNQQFQWHKKRDKEKKQGLTAEDIIRKDTLRRKEAEEELEKLKKKRDEREIDRQLREEEENKQRRMAEDALMADWIAKEDDFQLEQSRRRAGIRLREHRAKAIDFLAINLRFTDPKSSRQTAAIGVLTNPHSREVEREEEEEGWGWADAGFEFEIDEPWKIFDNLTLEDCIELQNDIKMYLNLEKSPVNIEFWQAMHIVCEHHLADLQNLDHAASIRHSDPQVEEATTKIVSGLSLQRLTELEDRANGLLHSNQPVDSDFWELVLKKIHVEKAVAKLNSIHEIVLKNRLEQFKRRQRDDAAKVQAELGSTIAPRSENLYGGDIHAEAGTVPDEGAEADDEEEDEDDYVELYDREMSPVAIDPRTMNLEERRLPIVNEEDELHTLFAARHTITAANFVPKHAQQTRVMAHTVQSLSRPSAADLEAERVYREEAEREARELGSDESEEEFGDLDPGLDLPSTYDWSDRYRPRKPRFFNRVHTGYEWSKYNQTHYDTDNPPPKVVQGYKFNIFYPDLIDKSKAPTYYLKPVPDDPDTQIIVFTAGPPYEDIAFRIVRRPWEYSHRKGFRSTFDRGVLQLYLNFTRAFYRK
ncbi:hypothetical protein L204_103990 [Cryptococcus depauperatus]